MSEKRVLANCFVNTGRRSPKQCSCLLVIFITGTAFLTWSTLILITASEFWIRQHRIMINNIITPPVTPVNSQELLDNSEWSDIGQTYLYDNLIQENPLGTYFSDHFGGKLPVGTSHLEFSRLDHQRPIKSVLIFVRNFTDSSIGALSAFFAKQRIEFKFRSIFKELPQLVVEDIGVPRYSLIVFDDYIAYLTMVRSRRRFLDSFCKNYNIGVLAFMQPRGNGDRELFSDKNLKFMYHVKLKQYKPNNESVIWRVLKTNEVYSDALPTSDWTIFITDHETYIPLVFSSFAGDLKDFEPDVNLTDNGCVIALHDQGHIDGIQRVILGHTLDFWLNTIVATDAITYLTGGLFALPLTRLLQVDIDDIFLAASGIRTLAKDAKALVTSQVKIRKHIPQFTYKLGFSGDFFMKGNEAEQDGDRELLKQAHHFVWTDHLYRHDRLLNVNSTILNITMSTSVQFAQEHNLPMMREYMVTPYHAGVYPVYEELYDAWRDAGVVCTSTMEYPKESPVWGRRGFIYRGVKVMPRIDCNLYTSVNRFHDIVGGKSQLDKSIRGGSLFKLFLHTPVLVFMTHMSNYARDQLGQYSFENVIKFVNKWTNLQLEAPPPMEIARRYFQMYPDEITPLWTNPCEYNVNHLEILPPHVSCSKFPVFIVVGTQRSGTTALQTLLKAHPMMASITGSVRYDKTNFFSGTTYLKGLNWYQNRFPKSTRDGVLFYETSNKYFHDEKSPKRIQALVPKAKIIILLADPISGAYSCFQNLRRLFDAMNYTLFEAVNVQNTAPKFLRAIRHECLKPRAYAVHIARWLHFFPTNQIFFVDGDYLRKNPIAVLNKLQRFINVAPYLDFTTKLRYDIKKGCFCRADGKCVSSLQAPPRPPMDHESIKFLQSYFKDHNSNLKILLNHINHKYPRWLADTSS